MENEVCSVKIRRLDRTLIAMDKKMERKWTFSVFLNWFLIDNGGQDGSEERTNLRGKSKENKGKSRQSDAKNFGGRFVDQKWTKFFGFSLVLILMILIILMIYS
jgi:hypothetical protein